MSSTDTIIIKKPDAFQNAKSCQKQYSNCFLSLCLWMLAAITSTSTTETSNISTGVTISFKVRDVVSMLFMTFMLTRGLTMNNPLLILPWLVMTCWNMYNYQYPGLIKMVNDLRRARSISKLAWVAYGFDVLGTLMKTVLVFRVMQLCITMWYQNKLQSETMMKA